MTQQPDDRQPDDHATDSDAEAQRRLDEDAAWAEIIANYGDRPEMGHDTETPGQPGQSEQSGATASRPRRNVFDRSFIESQTESQPESLNSEATWEDEGHFVPPPPPPLPVLEPRRKWAWIALFGAPALMLLAVVLGWRYPDIIMAGLVFAFVGGFVYLVATMRRRTNDPWSGDDGAVV